MRILFVGDVVGNSGMKALAEFLPKAITDWDVELVVVNGENAAAGGFGITEDAYKIIVAAGADAVTLGNHAWNRREALSFVDQAPRLIRPINYLPCTPGKGSLTVKTKKGRHALVIAALGRLFMEPVDDPFGPINRKIEEFPLGREVDAIVVDFHCEATGEKHAAGHFCDGRVSLVVGTHTHTPSADHRILPSGTAYITDVGMTGDYNSVVGMQREEPLRRFTTGIPAGRFVPATGAATVSAIAVETDDATGLAMKVSPVRLGGTLNQAEPSFWIS
jgi:hypothetical protein